jgi:hypothetical protein
LPSESEVHVHKSLRELERDFRPGYRLVDACAVGAHVEGPDGKRVRVDGKVLTIAVSDRSMHRMRRARALLIEAGVIEPPKRRRQLAERHEPQPCRAREAKSGPQLASEVLRDSRASPRERKLARELLALQEAHEKVRELAQRLGGALREREAQLDRRVA